MSEENQYEVTMSDHHEEEVHTDIVDDFKEPDLTDGEINHEVEPKLDEQHHDDVEKFVVDHEHDVVHHQPSTDQDSPPKAMVGKDDMGPTDEEVDLMRHPELEPILDERGLADLELIKTTEPNTALEHALSDVLQRKEAHILRLTNEITKLKAFISKRKQTYKRKRKDEGAPTRALSAYNIFIQDRFAQLAKENEKALKSTDADAQLKRVPPANLVASTGNQWKDLPPEEKAKYEERAKADRKRYEEQMAQYQPPDRASNRKRNKTGYNMFFSAHVLRLKQSENGVPSERGSVARLVGTAWKALSAEEKQYYEREADKHNGMHPVKDDMDDEDDEEAKRQHHHMADPYYGHMHHHQDMHAQMHGGHQPPHDPRYYPTHHMYTQPHYYDYSHHQQQHHHHSRHGQSRSHGGYYPSQQGWDR